MILFNLSSNEFMGCFMNVDETSIDHNIETKQDFTGWIGAEKGDSLLQYQKIKKHYYGSLLD